MRLNNNRMIDYSRITPEISRLAEVCIGNSSIDPQWYIEYKVNRGLRDLNGNGVWDTGLYEEHRRAEPLYYYNKGIEMRENWDYSEDWNPLAAPIDKQKPAEMKKGKAEKKEKKSKNEQREEQKRKRASGQSSSRSGNFGF